MDNKDLKEYIELMLESILSESDDSVNSLFEYERRNYTDKSGWFARHKQMFGRSKYHPAELEKDKLYKQLKKKQTAWGPRVFSLGVHDKDFDIPERALEMITDKLTTVMRNDPIAIKIMNGTGIVKREAMLLARRLMVLPYFPIQTPRKLGDLLMQLSYTNFTQFQET